MRMEQWNKVGKWLEEVNKMKLNSSDIERL